MSGALAPSFKPSFAPSSARMGEPIGPRLEELVKPAKFFAVDAAWVLADYFGHQLFPITEGAATPKNYYSGKLLWGFPALMAGRAAVDLIGTKNRFANAAIIATVANSLIQLNYLFKLGPEFNATVFLLHEAILIPLCLLIAGPDDNVLPGYGTQGKSAGY